MEWARDGGFYCPRHGRYVAESHRIPAPMDPTALPNLLHVLVASAVRGEVQAAVEAALTARLPEIIRRAALPPYLTRQQLAELTGWSLRKIDYLRKQRRIAFVRRGRTVVFPTAEVERYFDAGRLEAVEAAR